MEPSVQHEPSIRFGCFELKLRSEELVREGMPVKLPHQPFKVLAILAQNAGQLVTREELRQRIWGNDTFVDFDKGLNFCIKQIREALGDNAQHPQYVETLPRRGYRLISVVDACTAVESATQKTPQIPSLESPNGEQLIEGASPEPAYPKTSASFTRLGKYKRAISLVAGLALIPVLVYFLWSRFGLKPGLSGGSLTAASRPVESSRTVTGKTVMVQEIPAAWALVRDVRGSYQEHSEIFQELMNYVGSNYRAVGETFGIYPMDPDAAKPGNLRWEVGVRISPGEPLGYGNRMPLITSMAKSSHELQQERQNFTQPRPPYRIVLLEAIEAAVLESSVEETPKDGLSMHRWMAENGYVQVGPTRMEYLSHEELSNKIPTRIIVPVKKRASGLILPRT